MCFFNTLARHGPMVHNCQAGYVVELAVPWEDGLKKACKREKAKYSALATAGRFSPCTSGMLGGFVATSRMSLLKKMEVRGQSHHEKTKAKQQLALD